MEKGTPTTRHLVAKATRPVTDWPGHPAGEIAHPVILMAIINSRTRSANGAERAKMNLPEVENFRILRAHDFTQKPIGWYGEVYSKSTGKTEYTSPTYPERQSAVDDVRRYINQQPLPLEKHQLVPNTTGVRIADSVHPLAFILGVLGFLSGIAWFIAFAESPKGDGPFIFGMGVASVLSAFALATVIELLNRIGRSTEATRLTSQDTNETIHQVHRILSIIEDAQSEIKSGFDDLNTGVSECCHELQQLNAKQSPRR